MIHRERQKHPSLREFDKVVTIDDKFPKARLHSLVIAKDLELEGPADLRASHIPLLQVMKVRQPRSALLSPYMRRINFFE